MKIEAHTKQFVISKMPVLVRPDWLNIPLQNGYHISYCPRLNISKTLNIDYTEWLIIGTPTLTQDISDTPVEIIKNNSTSTIKSKINFWGGRWILITTKEIFTDASALLGLFYSIDKSVISSSPVLASTLINENNLEPYALSSEYYFNWFLTPGTSYKNVLKLLPSQSIKFTENGIQIEPKNLILKNYDSVTYMQLFDQLENLLINEIRFISNKYRIHVALSSGYDSRLIYSLAKKELKDNFSTYTHLYPTIPPDDFKIPVRISHNHRAIKQGRFNKETLRTLELHSASHVIDADRKFICYGQWDTFTSEDACLRGSILEMGGKSSAHLYDAFPPFTQTEHDPKICLYGMQDYRNFQLQALEKYFEWVNNRHPLPIEPKKRFYWEQRICGWLSYIEQSLDLLPVNSIQIGNSLVAINLFLKIPPHLMKIKSIHIDLMAKHTPEVLKHPFNKISSLDRLEQFARSGYHKVVSKITGQKTNF